MNDQDSVNGSKITQQHVKQCNDALTAISKMGTKIKLNKYPTAKVAAQQLRTTIITLRGWYQTRIGLVIGLEDDIPFTEEAYRNLKGRASTLFVTASRGKNDAAASKQHKDINKVLDAAKAFSDWQRKGYVAQVEFTDGQTA